MFTKREYARIGETVFYDTLENGMRLAVIPKRDFNKSLAFLAVDYGGADRRFRYGGALQEPPAGIAHFLEHKMFETESGDAMTALSRRGAAANAFTSADMTAYYFDCVDNFSENLNTLLGFVSVPYFTAESVEKEKPIIAQEIKMSEDDPDTALYYGLLRALFRRHPIREPILGTAESISTITPELLYTCHRALYAPSNMCLVVVGDQDPIRVRDAAERAFGKSYSTVPEREAPPKESEMPDTARVSAKMDVSETVFLAGAKAEPGLRGREAVKRDLTAALALNTLMSEASPLYRRLYDEGLINDTFSYDFETVRGAAFLSFGGEAKKPDEVIKRVLEEARRVSLKGLDGAYFARRKKAALGDELRALNSLDSIAYNVAVGIFNGYDYFETAPLVKEITAGDVQAFLGKWLTEERIAVSLTEKREAESDA